MLSVEKLTEQDIASLKCKKVVLCVDLEKAKEIVKILSCFDITVATICSNSTHPKKIKALPIIHENELNDYTKLSESIVVIPETLASVGSKFASKGIAVSYFDCEQLVHSFRALLYLQKIKKMRVFFIAEKIYWNIDRLRTFNIELFLLSLKKPKKPIVICLPMKTADYTLYNTFDFLNQCDPKHINEIAYKKGLSAKIAKFFYYTKDAFTGQEKLIEYANTIHKPRLLHAKTLKKFKKIKIITAVREPISQNLSVLYQEYPTLFAFDDWLLGELAGKGVKTQKETLNQHETYIKKYNNAVQIWFELYIKRYIYREGGCRGKSTHPRAIQNFHKEFAEKVVDITKYPFDQDKGFTVIKKDNVEVFVYQLEKLNDLIPELSSWLNVPFDKFINGNMATEKWSGDSYKRAQKEIEITQEYFDKCFDESYVKHCYSKADIEKFKARWRPHIKKET